MTPISETTVPLIEALAFAAERHRHHRRAGADAEPFINHPIRMLRRLIRAGVRDQITLIATVLHDVVEDDPATRNEDIAARFGREVADVVAELTDPPGELPLAERKRLQALRAPELSIRARTAKIVDQTDNITSMVESPPGWSTRRCLTYAAGAHAIVRACQGTHPVLEEEFFSAHARALAVYGPTAPGG